MKTGMLWYVGTPKLTFEEKVKQAVEYYQNKYGRLPELCIVNPKDMPDEKELPGAEVRIDGKAIPVRTERYILPFHFFIGIEIANEEPKEQPAPEPQPAVKQTSAADAFIQHAQRIAR